MTEESLNKLIAKRQRNEKAAQMRNDPLAGVSQTKGKRGGRRTGSGVKPKVSREWLTSMMAPDFDFVYAKLLESIADKDPAAMKTWFSYFAGLPKQVTEITGAEGAPLIPIQWIEQRTYASGETRLIDDDDAKLIGDSSE